MKASRIAPVVILVFLLIAWFVRWDYAGTRTYDDGALRWKTDRWTGYKWIEVYQIKQDLPCGDIPAYGNNSLQDNARKTRKTATNIWYGLVSADIIWIIAVWLVLPIKHKRKPEKTEIEP